MSINTDHYRVSQIYCTFFISFTHTFLVCFNQETCKFSIETNQKRVCERNKKRYSKFETPCRINSHHPNKNMRQFPTSKTTIIPPNKRLVMRRRDICGAELVYSSIVSTGCDDGKNLKI